MELSVISHYGGTRGVTGSCHQLHLGQAFSLLIDCGLEQGVSTASGAESAPLGFDVVGIQALIVTHVHLDHVDRIPALLAAGFRGPILCSEPSAKLLPVLLEDAYRLGVSSKSAHVAQYLELLKKLIVPVPFECWQDVIDRSGLKCCIRLHRAGHLLGSTYVECGVTLGPSNRRYVFSGDLGVPFNPLLRPTVPPERADVLVLESTYGDRLHPDSSDRLHKLEGAIDRALADQGTILIPAFSFDRTQELLYEIEDILYRKAMQGRAEAMLDSGALDWSQLPVILGSPPCSANHRCLQEPTGLLESRSRVAFGGRP